MVILESLSLRYGQKVLFDEICAVINVRDRIGLVGSNGAGKSTLLKAILGKVELDGGEVQKAGYVTFGYLPQDGLEVHGKTLFHEVESAFNDILSIKKRIEEANNQLDEMECDCEEYYELLDIIIDLEHRLEELDAVKLKSKIEKVLQGLGFSMSDMDRDCGEFSGGWQMRIALAKLLLQEPLILLLDEPTNHLDITSQRWLENYLKRYEGAMVIISHDRGFLDLLCNRTFEVTMGRLEVYPGNYSYFEKQKIERKLLNEQAFKNQQKKLEKTERFIERFRSKASKAKQVQSRIKALDKVERIEIEEEESSIGFKFPLAPPSGHVVVRMKDVDKFYDDKKVLKHINLKIEKGDKIAIVGVNGAGKSTLAKVIANIEPKTAGEIEMGYNVRYAYFAQQQADALDPEASALEVIQDAVDEGVRANHRSVLGSFLFRGDEVFKKTKVLSGGEKCRLALACMLVKKANFMVLDEPTNHLDMRSQETLQRALMDYQGTLLIVSHNRSFLDPIVNKVIEVRHQGIREFLGNVSYYLEKTEMDNLTTLAELSTPAKKEKEKEKLSSLAETNSKEKRRITAEQREALKPLKKQADQLELEIEKLEKIKADFESKMSDPDFFKKGDQTTTGMKEYHEVEKKLETSMKEWESITAQLAEIEE